MITVGLHVALTEEQQKDINSYLDFLNEEFPDRHYFIEDILCDMIDDGLRELHVFFGD